MFKQNAIIICLIMGITVASAAGAAEKRQCTPPNQLPSIETYYDSVSNLQGEYLKSGLHDLLATGSFVYDYKCIWSILNVTDQDPDNPDNVIELYTRRSVPKIDRDHGQNDPDSWNREHVWAKSHGFPDPKQYAYTDAHHLRPADRSVNTERSNRDFSDGSGKRVQECPDCIKGYDYTWFPGSAVKGDVARMMFYMATRYEGVDGDGGTPDLEIASFVTGKSEKGPQLGVLCDLYRWHQDDPVSDWERLRNERVFTWQANRNPFIDHPEWVESIWGGQCP